MDIARINQQAFFRFHGKVLLTLVTVSASACLYGLFAFHQSFTNDEGAYLYDARTILEGFLPAGDVLTKTPVVVMLFSASELITSRSLFAGRFINVIAGIATTWPLFLVMHTLYSKKVAWYASMFWLLGCGPIIFYSLGHTQAIASFFAVSTLALWVRGVRQASILYIFLSGACFALAYASRKIEIALIAPLIASWYVCGFKKQEALRIVGVFVGGFLLVVFPWIGSMNALYGYAGVAQAIGIGYKNIIFDSEVVPWAGGIDKILFAIIRICIPYTLGLLVLFAFMGKGVADRTKLPFEKIIWVLLGGISLSVANLGMEREWSFVAYIWIASGVLFFAWAIKSPFDKCFKQPDIVAVSWLIALIGLYAIWPTYLPEYLGDFLIPLTIIGAVLFSSMKRRYGILFLTLLACANVVSLQSVYVLPWTGMFKKQAVRDAATYLNAHVLKTDAVFAAAVIVPYVSGHHVPFNVTHPQWYTYKFISDLDKEVFLPDRELLHEEVGRLGWGIQEQLSDYVYPGMFSKDWHVVETIENSTGYRNNPLKIVERARIYLPQEGQSTGP